MSKETNLSTTARNTWCPGCFNFSILSGIRNVLQERIKTEKDKEKYAIASGIGCHAKIFDYLNLNGLNALHGRVIPICLGMKIGNPNLNVIGFSGDGDAYAEGIEHLVHAARYNANFKYIVHNNQVFALTVGQPTPTTEVGFKDKTTPLGVKLLPLNPIKLMLSANASFVARVFAEPKQIEYVLKQALEHKGFAFIEVLQPCIIFHPDANYKPHLYSLEESKHDKSNMQKAIEKADEWDYNNINEKTKIPVGIFYQKERASFEEVYPALAKLKKEGISWKEIER